MLVTKKALSRRSLLRGMGVSLALPALDAMAPALLRGAGQTQPLRLAFVYVPNGIIMKDWTPAAEGKGYALPKTLAPLAAYREVCDGFLRVNTPGSTCADLFELDYRNRRKPLYPLEKLT